MKDSFVIYTSINEVLKELTDSEKGILFQAIIDYQMTGEVPELPRDLKLFFITVKQDLDRNNQKYEETCERRREAGKKGGRPKKQEKVKKANGFSEKQKKQNKAKEPEYENEYENENEYEHENENVSPNGDRKENKQKKANDLFEYLWSLYPNKKGKGQVSDKSKRKLAEIGSDEMERAIDRYLSELAKDDWRKPQNGSTFFNSGYIDYLDCNFVPSAPIARDGPEGIDIMNIDF